MKRFLEWLNENKYKIVQNFAKEKHDAIGKVRKLSGLPYFTHPNNVANLLMNSGCSSEVIMAGYLHDTTEDANVHLDEIREKFGDRVAELVAGASEPDKSASWDDRKKHTINFLTKTNDPEILLVVVADKLDNLMDTESHGKDVWKNFNAPYDKQKWYYATLSDIFMEKIPQFPLAKRYKNLVDKIFAR